MVFNTCWSSIPVLKPVGNLATQTQFCRSVKWFYVVATIFLFNAHFQFGIYVICA